MTPKQQPETYSPQEAQEREREALAAALSMGARHYQESSPKMKRTAKKKGK
jgi:hypothetical protein